MKRVVVAGAGTAGLELARRLGGKRDISLTVLEKHGLMVEGGFGELANSSPCTFKDVLQRLAFQLKENNALIEAIRKDALGFGDTGKFPHFDKTYEGPERRARIVAMAKNVTKENFEEWFLAAVVQNPLGRFAFMADGAERCFKTGLVKIDPVALHRILAAGNEGNIHFAESAGYIDRRKKIVYTDKGKYEYDVLADASGSAMVASPHFIPLEWHNCYEHLLRLGKPLPQWFVERAAFRIDLDPNANPKDPTNTSCVWIYPIDRNHVIIGPDDYIGYLIRQNPDVTREDIIRILRTRLIADLDNDPLMKGFFSSYEILESRFNTIPQAGLCLEPCANGVVLIGDAGLGATPAAAEGIRRGIEFADAAALAIMAANDDESLSRIFLRMRKGIMSHDPTFVFARIAMFNGYNDKTWKRQLELCQGIDDATMEKLLRNTATLKELLPALPIGTFAYEFSRRVLRGELVKEVYDGRSMRE